MAFLTLMAAAGAAVAMRPGSVLEHDVGCLAALAMAGSKAQKEGKDANGVMIFTMFYIGKIEGEPPGFDLGAGLRRVASKPDYETAIMPKDLARCLDEINNQAAKLETVAQALEKKSG